MKRPFFYRPQAEFLEDRLPPGDTGLLGWSLFGPQPGFGTATSEIAIGERLPADEVDYTPPEESTDGTLPLAPSVVPFYGTVTTGDEGGFNHPTTTLTTADGTDPSSFDAPNAGDSGSPGLPTNLGNGFGDSGLSGDGSGAGFGTLVAPAGSGGSSLVTLGGEGGSEGSASLARLASAAGPSAGSSSGGSTGGGARLSTATFGGGSSVGEGEAGGSSESENELQRLLELYRMGNNYIPGVTDEAALLEELKARLTQNGLDNNSFFISAGGGRVSATGALPDPGALGPLEVTTQEYNFGNAVFFAQNLSPAFPGFPGGIELIASVHAPTDLSAGPLPLIMFMHGRHGTAFTPPTGGGTLTWPPGPGQLSITSYQGYDYVGRVLASHGYVVVSVSANAINSRDNGTPDLGMSARAQLLQRHLDIWRDLNNTGTVTGTEIPDALRTPFSDRFVGKVDLQNIGTMGHSRGGDGVVRHYALNQFLGSPYGIKAVFPLAPVDFSTFAAPAPVTVNNAALMVLLPYNDGDVSDLQGARFFDRARYLVAGDNAPKHTLLVIGANHNFYNTVWTPGLFPFPGAPAGAGGTFDDGAGAPRLNPTQVQGTGLAYMSAFFRTYIGGETQFFPYLTGDEPPPPSAVVGPSNIFLTYHPADNRASRLDVNRLDVAARLTTNTLGGAVTQSGLTPYTIAATFQGLQGLQLGWSAPTAFWQNELPEGSRNISNYFALQFRAALNFADARNPAGQPQNFQIVLTDGAGNSASTTVSEVYADRANPLYFPPQNRHRVMNGVRIPLAAFSGVDLTNVVSIRFNFNQTATGALWFSDLMFANRALAFSVVSTDPAAGAIVTAPPTDFRVTFSEPYDADTVEASDLQVNGIAASGFTLTSETVVTFTFDPSPVTAEGLQTMTLAAGAINRAVDGDPLEAFNSTFRFDLLRLAVVSTTPPVGSLITLPFTTLDVTFNEPILPSSAGTNDLTLSQGTVTAFVVQPGNQTVRYTLANIVNEGTLTVNIGAGALTDVFGNPSVVFTGTYTLDIGTIAFPTPFTSRNPLGSLIYERARNGIIGPAGDTDNFTLDVDPGQTIAVVVRPTSGGLRPTVELRDPSGTLVGSNTASAAGQPALVQAVAVPSGGTYTVTVGGAAGTTGDYAVTVTLNAALEAESFGGARNDSRDVAQSLDTNLLAVGIGSVIGRTDDPAELEPNNTQATATSSAGSFAAFTGNLYHLGISGQINVSNDSDWFSIGQLQVGDIITITMSASGSSRGSLGDSFVELHRGLAATPILVAQDDDAGPGLDSIVFRFTVTTTDNYFVRARPFGGGDTGTYQLGVFLENTGAAPLTGGTLTSETEPNDSAAQANDASTSWRQVQFLSRIGAQISPAGDVDFYRYDFAAGDLVTVVIDSTSAVDVQVNLRNAAGTIIASENGESPTIDSYLYAFQIPTTGTYFVEVTGVGTGAYRAEVYLSTGTPPSPLLPPGGADYYSLNLNAGDTATFALTGPAIGGTVTLENSSGTVLAQSRTGATNFGQLINGFVAPATGTYFVRVSGEGGEYTLVATRNADFNTEPNNTFLATPAQALVRTAEGHRAIGHVGGAGDPVDIYQVSVAEGSFLQILTATPGDGPGEFTNTLNPFVRLYGPDGSEVNFDDNSAADGRNAALSHLTASAGLYFIEVGAAAGSSGEYLLTVLGADNTLPSFEVVSTLPADKARLIIAPTTLTVVFNDNVLLTSLEASDLQVDGVAATGLTILDGGRVQFTLAGGLGQGLHFVTIAAGALTDLQGTPIAAYEGQFIIDSIGPRVIDSSIDEDDTLPIGSLTYTVQFDEPLNAALIDASDFTLQGLGLNRVYAPTSFSYIQDLSILTITYDNLPDDNYRLTLISGINQFRDLAGNNLDGEPPAGLWQIPPQQSGNGVPGGNFFVNFNLDQATVDLPTPFTAVNPLGSLIYQSQAQATVAPAGDTDSFTLTVDAGQTITVLVDPSTTLRPVARLLDPSSTEVGVATAAAAGQDAVIQTVATVAGTYTIEVGGFGASTGFFTVRAVLNAALEAENHGGLPNNSRPTAQSLTDAFIDLGAGASRAAVVGTSDVARETEPNNTVPTANSATGTFTAFTGNLYHLGIGGTITPANDSDWFNLGQLQVGDVVTLSMSGSPSLRGTLANPLVQLYRGSAATPILVVQDNDNGPGLDALVFRFTVTATDTYYVRALASGAITGIYQLGIFLENNPATAAPLTGGTVTTETEPNNVGATINATQANNISTSWRPVQFRSQIFGSISPAAGDQDFFQYQFTAGDLVTINIDSTSAVVMRVILRNAAGTIIAIEDGSSVGPGLDSPIYAFVIPATGSYFVQVFGGGGTGTYTAEVLLSTNSPPVLFQNFDYYSFTLNAGETVSLVATALTGSLVNLALESADGTTLRTGQTINNFVAPAAGTFFARITGDGGDYSLVVTRNADFNTEPNDTSATAQDITGTRGALGFFSSTDTATFDAIDFGRYDSTGFHNPANTNYVTGQIGGAEFRNWFVFDLAAVNRSITSAELRLFNPANGFVSPDPTETYAVFDVTTSISTLRAGGSGLTAIFGDLGSGVSFGAQTVSSADNGRAVVIQLNSAALAALNASRGSQVAVGGALTTLSGPADQLLFGFSGVAGLARQLVLTLPDDDWYRVTLAAGQTLDLSTLTPADGSGQFVNSLNPRLELFNPAGDLVASGTALEDGRNESLSFTATVGGVYRIRVTAEGGTRGEYFLQSNVSSSSGASAAVARTSAFAGGGSGTAATAGSTVTAPATPTNTFVNGHVAPPEESPDSGDRSPQQVVLALPEFTLTSLQFGRAYTGQTNPAKAPVELVFAEVEESSAAPWQHEPADHLEEDDEVDLDALDALFADSLGANDLEGELVNVLV